MKRMDGRKLLKATAVPSLFCHRPLPSHRKSPTKRGSGESPSKAAPKKRVKIEHSYSTQNSKCAEELTHAHDHDISESQPGVFGTDESMSSEQVAPTETYVHNSQPSSSTTMTPVPASLLSSSSFCQNLYCAKVLVELKNLQKEHCKVKKLCKELKSKLKNLQKKQRLLSANMSALNCKFGKFLNRDQQLALCRKSSRGLKWQNATIKKSLKLHFACGPTGYSELLSQGYPLPSCRTLLRHMQPVKFESGLLTEVFTFLKLKVTSMKAEERFCSLTVDEMSISPAVEFDNHSGCFIGDVSLPNHSRPATHALVFMLAGLSTRWKQTVAYYFTGNSTDGSVLADIVLKIISSCHEIGVTVMNLTSDMGSSNRAMWKKLGVISDRNVIVNKFLNPFLENEYVFVLADVPHLIKNLRNHLVNNQKIILPDDIVNHFDLPCSTVSIEPLKRLALYQADKEIKPAPKLIKKLLEPSHFDKMKVSFALNVFSHSVAAALKLMVETQRWEKDVLTTAWFLETMNHWFDLMSSRHPIMALSKFNPSKHEEAIGFLKMIVNLFKHVSIRLETSFPPGFPSVICPFSTRNDPLNDFSLYGFIWSTID